VTTPAPVLVEGAEALEPFVVAGVLDAASVHVAATVARAVGGLDPDVVLAVALAARAPQHGHVCMVPATIAGSVVVDERATEPVEARSLPWPEVGGWIERIVASPAVRVEGDPARHELTPLVWDGERLYLERYWRYEQRVAEALTGRGGAGAGLFEPGGALEAALDRCFSPDPSDAQRRAAMLALTRRVAVIAGGPGTGKTRTIARLVDAAGEVARASGRTIELALAAPTGKAASRMAAALAHEIEAVTVHRLLGAMGGLRFLHDRRDPLPHDLVIVDEASMVSLPLMARLLDALRPQASLVLVGDPDQLASIEAGAVLGEITASIHDEAGAGRSALAGNVVTLDRVHRFDAASDIAALADAVRSGDPDTVLGLLDDAAAPMVRWVEPTDPSAVDAVQREVAADAVEVVRAARWGDHERAVALLPVSKVLAATRHGPQGSHRWRDRIEALVAATLPEADLSRRWYPGRPVLVTRNDPLNRLVNGDVGLVVAGEPATVVFSGPGGELRPFAPSQLADIETWWSMTIHKSQGSEFERVVVALPEAPSPVLSRELLYTAVTRAEQQVTIVASEASLRQAVSHRVARASGLGARLRSDR
jgi:exodeoxyribonuclease V alpha subunit